MKKRLIHILMFICPITILAGNHLINSDVNSQNELFLELQLASFGLQNEVFQLALKGYQQLDLQNKLTNNSVITIIDFSQSSAKKRMYVIDLLNRKLLFNTYVAHGRNTGDEFARSFSNETGTLKSSLGFYLTENPSVGAKVGPSLIINGVEKGFNDKAVARAIIMHGADYATENFIRKTGRLGRSFGCPAVPRELIKPVTEKIKGGSCMFIYYPDQNYLCHSELLHHQE